MIIITVKNVTCTVHGIDTATGAALYEYLSFDVEGAQFSDLYKKGDWDGRKHLYKPAWQIFPTGLLRRVAAFLIQAGHEISYVDERQTFPLIWNELPSSLELRDYQSEALEILKTQTLFGLTWPRGVLHHATGAGKTEWAAAITASLRRSTLFLVDRRDLLRQTAARFEKLLDCPVMRLGDGNHEFGEYTVATFQTAGALLKDDTTRDVFKEFLSTVEVLIVDECHRTQAKQFSKTINAVDAYVRVGLSATVLEGNTLDNWQLIGSTGELIHRVTAKEGWEAGWLARPKLYPVKVEGHCDLSHVYEYDDIYQQGIVAHADRNSWIAWKISECIAAGKPVIALVWAIEHGKAVESLCSLLGGEVPFVHGEMKTDERERIVARFRAGEIQAIIASSVFNYGMNIPEIQVLIIGAGGRGWNPEEQKYGQSIKQILGRGLRPKPGDNTVEIYDFLDMGHPRLRDHSRERMALYMHEGYEIMSIQEAGLPDQLASLSGYSPAVFAEEQP